jgi:hypothetical protein
MNDASQDESQPLQISRPPQSNPRAHIGRNKVEGYGNLRSNRFSIEPCRLKFPALHSLLGRFRKRGYSMHNTNIGDFATIVERHFEHNCPPRNAVQRIDSLSNRSHRGRVKPRRPVFAGLLSPNRHGHGQENRRHQRTHFPYLRSMDAGTRPAGPYLQHFSLVPDEILRRSRQSQGRILPGREIFLCCGTTDVAQPLSYPASTPVGPGRSVRFFRRAGWEGAMACNKGVRTLTFWGERQDAEGG